MTWVVRGAGFGHGVGMSAYGAYGYGLNGGGYRRILHHYYRGVRIGRADVDQRVRVLVRTGTDDVVFRGARRACGERLSRSRFYRAHLGGRGIVLLRNEGTRVARCGGALRAKGAPQFQVRGTGTYRGTLSVVRAAGGGLNAVDVVPLDQYVRGSVPSEVPASWPAETLKAMAVAIRSIALSTDVGGRGFDLYADTRTQVYDGVSAEAPRSNRAVRQTRGQVVTYGGEVVQATYFSSSGGRTESAFLGAPQAPYLRSVADPYDTYSPLHRWTLRFSQAEMQTRLAPFLLGRLRRIVVTQRGDTPRIVTANLVGSRGVTQVSGDDLRFSLGLYERWAYFQRVR